MAGRMETGMLAPANNLAAVAAIKADAGAIAAFGTADSTNSQLSRRDDATALGDKSAMIGTHAYSVTPDESLVRKGVLNAKVELSALGADPQIGGAARLGIGSGNAAQQGDARDFLK